MIKEQLINKENRNVLIVLLSPYRIFNLDFIVHSELRLALGAINREFTSVNTAVKTVSDTTGH